MKRLISLLMASVLLFGLPVTVLAEESKPESKAAVSEETMLTDELPDVDESAEEMNLQAESAAQDDEINNDQAEEAAEEQTEEQLLEYKEGDEAKASGSYLNLPPTFVAYLNTSTSIPYECSSDIYSYNIQWSCDNSNMLSSVYQGSIYPSCYGACVVTASVPSKGLESRCTVIVYPVGLNITSNTIPWNESFYLDLNGVSAGVEWTSSNNYVATVSNGLVQAVAPGSCVISATYFGRRYDCYVTVEGGINYTYLELYKGEKFKLDIYGGGKIKWKSSKKSVATVNSKGWVKGKKPGTTTITAKVNGKTYKCKVRVFYREPDFSAVLYDYDTRGNYFTVKFYNNGPSTVTINSGIKVEDVDYKSYDRKIRLKKKVKIKPGQTKFVRFYVKGRVTWWDYQDFTLGYKFTYDGKKYTGHVWDEESVYYDGGWYGTYDDEDWYQWWIQY